MPSLDFPSNPTDQQTYTLNGITYQYNAAIGAWLTLVVGSPPVALAANTQVLYSNNGLISGSSGLVFNNSANTLYANTINVSSNMRVYGNLQVGSGTVTITNNSIEASSIIVAGSAIPSGNAANLAYATANAAYSVANTSVQNTTSSVFAGISNNSSYFGGILPNLYRMKSDGQVIPAGSNTTFNQTSAPTGWTKVTTYNDYAMRIVSGSVDNKTNGVAFTTAFAAKSVSGTVGNTTLSTNEMPSHTHTAYAPVHSQNDAGSQGYPNNDNHQSFRTSDRARDRAVASAAISNVGGGGAHNHSFSGTNIDLSVNYVDFILATAN